MKHSQLFRLLLCALLLVASVQAAAVPASVLAQDEGSWDGGDGGGGGGGCPDPLINKDCTGADIPLLQPLDDATNKLPASDVPLETFFKYFNLSWPWLLGVASGIAVLQAVWGGVLIMTSWDRDAGKEKIEWAVGGMVMIALAGFILRFLNPIYYA